MTFQNFTTVILFALLLAACQNESNTAADTFTDGVATNSEKQTQLDRQLIREYVALQTDMVFDSTESGIFYHLENPGFGDPPSDSSTVTAHYTLYLVDGTLVQSSLNRGEPITFKLSEVITGWREALKMLGVTGSGTFVIPSTLAYGNQPPTSKIPRNAVLVFDIELLEAHD